MPVRPELGVPLTARRSCCTRYPAARLWRLLAGGGARRRTGRSVARCGVLLRADTLVEQVLLLGASGSRISAAPAWPAPPARGRAGDARRAWSRGGDDEREPGAHARRRHAESWPAVAAICAKWKVRATVVRTRPPATASRQGGSRAPSDPAVNRPDTADSWLIRVAHGRRGGHGTACGERRRSAALMPVLCERSGWWSEGSEEVPIPAGREVPLGTRESGTTSVPLRALAGAPSARVKIEKFG